LFYYCYYHINGEIKIYNIMQLLLQLLCLFDSGRSIGILLM